MFFAASRLKHFRRIASRYDKRADTFLLTAIWSVSALGLSVILIVGLIALSGDTLAARFDILVDTGNADEARLTLWGAALCMLGDAPLLGLGDYLEFSAGIGLPAAIAWWCGWLMLVLSCARGVFARRRNQHFAVVAVGASVLVAVHSSFDFSLQIPAVSLLYVTLWALGWLNPRRRGPQADRCRRRTLIFSLTCRGHSYSHQREELFVAVRSFVSRPLQDGSHFWTAPSGDPRDARPGHESAKNRTNPSTVIDPTGSPHLISFAGAKLLQWKATIIELPLQKTTPGRWSLRRSATFVLMTCGAFWLGLAVCLLK